MNTHLEIEYKQLLTKEIYEKIKDDYFKNSTPFTQTNNYFTDQKGILSNLRYSLRVRELNDAYEFTLKIPQGFSKLEINDMISKENYQNLLNHQPFSSPVFDELNKVDVSIRDLTLLTSLTTTRLEKEYEGGVLSIDVSYYGNIIDYEVEYEATSEEEGKAIFQNFLQPYHLIYTQNCPGKFTRALKEAKK